MTDLALVQSPGGDTLAFDLALDGAALATDAGLRTSVVLSLFTDARARDDDLAIGGLAPGQDRRGWWGDALPPAGTAQRELGSRLWTLARAPLTTTTVNRARGLAEEALAWLVADGVAGSIEVVVEATAADTLALGVTVVRADGSGARRYDVVWQRP